MNIIVCAKQICHTYAGTGKNPDTKYITPEDSIFRVNPYDEAATELALRLKETASDTRVSLLTLGDMISEAQLRRCLATGPDHLYQMDFIEHKDSDPFFQPDPWVKADLISQAAKSLDADLILCGKESLDRASGQVGALVARQLNLPFVSAIIDLFFDQKTRKVNVLRSAGRGVREMIECALPAVFSVDLGAALRLPTLEKRKSADAYDIRTLPVTGETIPATRICRDIFQPRPRPRILRTPDSAQNSFDRVLQLLAGSRVEKKGELLTGSTASQVEGIIRFLKNNGFIESGHKRE